MIANNQLLAAERDVIRNDADVREWLDDDAGLAQLVDNSQTGELSAVPLGRPMHYTSGTTGRPKGVWTGVLAEVDAARLWGEEREQWGFATDDVHLVCSPLQHSAPIRFALSTLLAGGSVVIPGAFSVERIAAAMRDHRPTTTFCTASAPAAPGRGRCTRCVCHVASRGPRRLAVRRGAEASCHRGDRRQTLWEFYGSTEGQFTVCSSDEWLQRPGTVGKARPGRRLEVGEDEVVWCESPAWARWTYWRDPERTAEAWRDDSFTVGDLGRIDADGYLFLVGRRSDLIISGAVNVYPAEVENILAATPGVIDVVVFPRADKRWGQRVVCRRRRRRHRRGVGVVRVRAPGAVQAAEGNAHRRRDPPLRAGQGATHQSRCRARPGVTPPVVSGCRKPDRSVPRTAVGA